MRKKDCEVTDREQIDRIIQSCDCCRLGFADGLRPYIVPLNFGYVRRGERQYFYFHGAPEGRKLELARQNGCAGFELDTGHELRPADGACGYSFCFESVIGAGAVREVTDREEKRQALACIMEHYSGRRDWTFPDQAVDRTAVIELAVEEMACKVRAK